MQPIWKQIREPFERWLSLPNYDVVDVVAATVIANRLKGEPLWVAIVGASSSGKTEVVRALEGVQRVHQVDNFTTATLASGYSTESARGKRKEDYGLLKKMMDGRPHIITINDFSTVLKGRYDVRDKVMSQLRRLYDGKFDASYGNDVNLDWKGKIGIIACSTGVYDREMGAQSAFGDRFLVCRTITGDAVQIAEKSGRNSADSENMRAELRKAMKLIDKVRIPKTELKLPLGVRTLIARLTAFVARARTQVPRDQRSRAIVGMPEIEGTGRASAQLHQLLRGLMVLRNVKTVSELEVEIIERVALGTIPTLRMEVIKAISSRGAEEIEIEAVTGLPRTVLYRVLEELQMVGLVKHDLRPQNKRAGKFVAVDEFKPFFYHAYKTGGEL
jgi:hypothetical protein